MEMFGCRSEEERLRGGVRKRLYTTPEHWGPGTVGQAIGLKDAEIVRTIPGHWKVYHPDFDLILDDRAPGLILRESDLKTPF